MAELRIPYTPRDAFKPYHANTKRFSCSVCHRRAGKTVARLNRLIKDAITCKKLNPRFGYLSPYYVQSKEIAWQYLKHYVAGLGPLNVKPNEGELSITFGHNNAVIKLYGAENAERIRGTYFDGIVVDEAQGISGAVLRTIIMPALSDRQGWLDLSGTPKGWKNLLGEVVKVAQDNHEQWFLQILKASDSGIIPLDELALQQKMMSSNEFEQEYECSFDAAITGAVYGKQLAEMQQLGRIKAGLYDPELPVNTAWDLGYSDKVAIWFWQRVGMEVRMIDFYQASFEDMAHYVQVLKDRAYKYGDHYVPHDAANKTLAAGGKSVIEILHKAGIKTRLVAATSQMNQIEATRWVMRNMWIDSKCDVGISCLREYRYRWIEDKQAYSDEPRHDENSHCFTGDTKVLTRHVVCQIMNLPLTGEVLTSCGWKQYRNPRITRRNAPLVEVAFSDGTTVRCTPEHLFKTVSGWKSASTLQRGSQIQSGLTQLCNTLMASYTRHGRARDILHQVRGDFIGKFGSKLSALFQMAAISTTKTATQPIIYSRTSNASTLPNISVLLGAIMSQRIESEGSANQQERKLKSGTSQKRGGYGISVMLSVLNHGRKLSEKLKTVLSAEWNIWPLYLRGLTLLNSVAPRAGTLTIESVRHLDWCEDVWCITVPDVAEFSLANGAIVHNCADACEIIGQVLRKEVQKESPPKPKFLEEMTLNDLFESDSSSNNTYGRI